MRLSVEINGIHDLILFDTFLDSLAYKWKADVDDDEEDDDDAEDEQCDCDDEPAEEACDDAECEAHRKALDELAKCLRASGVADVTFHYCGDAKRSDGKR